MVSVMSRIKATCIPNRPVAGLKRPPKHTHVRMHSHHDGLGNAALAQQVIDLSVIGNASPGRISMVSI